jgi:transcriptional regulator with XRE-family HTH domain
MPTVDQIRQKILGLMQAAGDRPVPLAEELNLERNHLRDYFEGKKNSLKIEVLQLLSERYDIPLGELVAKKEKPSRRRA